MPVIIFFAALISLCFILIFWPIIIITIRILTELARLVLVLLAIALLLSGFTIAACS